MRHIETYIDESFTLISDQNFKTVLPFRFKKESFLILKFGHEFVHPLYIVRRCYILLQD